MEEEAAQVERRDRLMAGLSDEEQATGELIDLILDS